MWPSSQAIVRAGVANFIATPYLSCSPVERHRFRSTGRAARQFVEECPLLSAKLSERDQHHQEAGEGGEASTWLPASYKYSTDVGLRHRTCEPSRVIGSSII